MFLKGPIRQTVDHWNTIRFIITYNSLTRCQENWQSTVTPVCSSHIQINGGRFCKLYCSDIDLHHVCWKIFDVKPQSPTSETFSLMSSNVFLTEAVSASICSWWQKVCLLTRHQCISTHAHMYTHIHIQASTCKHVYTYTLIVIQVVNKTSHTCKHTHTDSDTGC